MDILEKQVDGVAVLMPVGPLDKKGSAELEKRALGLLEEDHKRIVVDFDQVEDIGSSGLRVLLMLDQKLRSREGALALCALDDRTYEVFEISEFTGVFSISQTQSQAIRRLPSREDPRFSTITGLAANFLGLAPHDPGQVQGDGSAAQTRRRTEIVQLADLAAELLGATAELERASAADDVGVELAGEDSVAESLLDASAAGQAEEFPAAVGLRKLADRVAGWFTDGRRS